MSTKPGSRIKKGRTLTTAGIALTAFLILLVLAAAGTGLISSFWVTQNPYHTKEVKMDISVFGDDVVIYISGGRDADELREMILIINGIQLTEDQARQQVQSSTCVFSGAVKDISGTCDISVKGVFSDGATATLESCRIRCS